MAFDPRTLDSRIRDEVLKVDTPCKRCGFNLRGLARWTRCPECALPVHDTAGDAPPPAEAPAPLDEKGDPIAPQVSPFVERDPLRPRPLLHYKNLPRADHVRMALASTLVSLGVLALGAGMLVAFLVLFARAQTWLGIGLDTALALGAGIAGFIGLPAVVVWSIGQWMLTPDLPPTPATKGEAMAIAHTLPGLMVGTSRRWVFLVRLAPMLWALPMLCIVGSVLSGGPAAGGSGQVLLDVGLIAALVASVAHALTCIHLREVALVFADDLCARRCWETTLLLPVQFLLLVTIITPGDVFAPDLGITVRVTHGFIGVLTALFFLGAIVWPLWRFTNGTLSLAAACRGSVSDDARRQRREAEKHARVQRTFDEAEARRRAGDET